MKYKYILYYIILSKVYSKVYIPDIFICLYLKISFRRGWKKEPRMRSLVTRVAMTVVALSTTKINQC